MTWIRSVVGSAKTIYMKNQMVGIEIQFFTDIAGMDLGWRGEYSNF
jgi:hypothetical protein